MNSKPPLPKHYNRNSTMAKTMTTNFSSKQLSITEKRSFFSKLNAASFHSPQKNQVQFYEGLSRKEAVKAMIN